MDILKAFSKGLFAETCSRRSCIRKDKRLRTHLTEKQIDKMVADSFPASDPPSLY